MNRLLKPSLDWLLIFVPVALALEYLRPESHGWIFGASCLGIIPLAGWLGKATEHLAERTGEAIGGLLNATFGNAAELIIAIVAVQKGLYPIVKASLTGSIIGNILLVMGGAMLAGGYKHKILKFNPLAARSQAAMLLLASISLIVPAAFHYLGGRAGGREDDLSMEISVVLLITYALSLFFSLRTHKQFFGGKAAEAPSEDAWSVKKSVLVLAGVTVLLAWLSEVLVGSVESAAASLGMTSIFVGVIVVAIVGNAAEHSTAILAAMNNKMDLSLGVAIGSSVQIALFVAPLIVLISYFVGPTPMDLVFTPAEVLAIFLAALITGEVTSDGETNWFEGVQLLAVYLILALIFFFLPEPARHAF